MDLGSGPKNYGQIPHRVDKANTSDAVRKSETACGRSAQNTQICVPLYATARLKQPAPYQAATCAGARRLRSLSVTSFPSASVLGRQSSRLPTGHMPRAPVLPCLRRSNPVRGMSGHLISLTTRVSSGGGRFRAWREGITVDYVGHFLREVAAFEAAGRVAAGFEAAPVVPSCPGWVATDLVLHLGVVHRAVSRVIGERMQQPPERGDMPWLGLAEEWRGWLPPAHAPQRSPVRPVCLAGSMTVRRTSMRASARRPRRSRCGPGQRTTVSASGSGCRRSRLLSTGGMPRMRWGRSGPLMRRLPPMPSGRPSRSWPRCGVPYGRRRQGTASGSCSSARTGRGGGGAVRRRRCLGRYA